MTRSLSLPVGNLHRLLLATLAICACGGTKDAVDGGGCPTFPEPISSPCGSVSVSPSVVAPGGQITATVTYNSPCMTVQGGIGNLPTVALDESSTIIIAGETLDGASQPNPMNPSSGYPSVGGSQVRLDGTGGSHSVTFTIAPRSGSVNATNLCPTVSCATNVASTQCMNPSVVLTTNQGNALAPFAVVSP